MSKKEKIPSTPETRAKALADKQEVRKVFKKTFFPALAICLCLLLIYSVSYMAFFKPAETTEEGAAAPVISDSNSSYTPGPSTDTNTNTNTPADNNSSSSDNNSGTNTPAADNNSSAAASNNGSSNASSSAAISASSSAADVVNYFNTAINKVKPSAKQITLVKETNSEAGGIEGNLPGSLTNLANSLVSSNMGEKDLSKLDPGMVNATTVEQKNAMFPVENESWSSKLTADDIEKFDVKDNGGKYEITLYVKADELSAATAHGQGHNGKVFSVIMPSIVTDNAGAAASIIKEVKTGHKDGKVTITVDKASGNVTAANYYFVWTLSVKALGVEISIPFGLEKQFTIAW